MPTSTIIRPIMDSDTESVIVLWHQAGIMRPWNDPRHDLAFARKGPHSTVLVAAEGTVIAGTAMIGEDGHRGWIYYVSTAPDHRGQGIGQALMEEAERWLAERGIWKVQLLVRADNEQARGFYEKLGYVDTRSICMQKVLSTS
jgi:ribosomal protein S18 acetylase RimI-like enzyme